MIDEERDAAVLVLAAAGLLAEPVDGHVQACAGGCGTWVATGTPLCQPYPCRCAQTRAAAPESSQRQEGGATCWWQKKGYENAPDGGFRSRCDCWGANPERMPEDCCSRHPASPRLLDVEQMRALARFIPRAAQQAAPVVVTLTDEDVRIALEDAGKKKATSIAEGYDRNIGLNVAERTAEQGWTWEVWGCLGEAAVHRYLGLPYSGTDGRMHDFRDAGPFEVRATMHRGGREHLPIRTGTGDRPWLPYVLAIVPEDVENSDDRKVVLAGWRWGFECALPEFWKGDYGQYWVPKDQLRPMVRNPGSSPYVGSSDEELDVLGAGTPTAEVVVSAWDGWGEPPEPKPYVRRWQPADLVCAHTDGQIPKGAIHCPDCCQDWGSQMVHDMHRSAWHKPCRSPFTLVDVDTGQPLVYQDEHGVWRMHWHTQPGCCT
jgi:hypothetical protein